ncbi:MAG TPA: hypothetical protein VIH42_05775 [Thermoguttaceae bacterium]
MSKKHIFTGVIFLTMIVAIVWSLSWSGAFAQATHSGHDHSEHGMSSPAEHNSTGTDHPSETLSAPHGGQINKTANYNIEIVYLPKEIRVYLYDSKDKPVAPRGATGQIVMQVKGNQQALQYPLKPSVASTDATEPDHLAAAIDNSRIRDGDATVTVELSGLPKEQNSRVSFTQTFALSKPPLTVTVAQLTEADQAGIASQKVCPVSGGKLGSMGTPIKVMVGNQPIYLCCEACIRKVQDNPAQYVAKAAKLRGN